LLRWVEKHPTGPVRAKQFAARRGRATFVLSRRVFTEIGLKLKQLALEKDVRLRRRGMGGYIPTAEEFRRGSTPCSSTSARSARRF
jgi:hypothetical protein